MTPELEASISVIQSLIGQLVIVCLFVGVVIGWASSSVVGYYFEVACRWLRRRAFRKAK